MSDLGGGFPTTAIVTASSAVVIWVATRFYELFKSAQDRKSEKRRYLIALYTEIDFNTKDMEIFLEESSSIEAVVERVRQDKDFVPHITDARHTDIYRQNMGNIVDIGPGPIGKLVYFYGVLEKLRTQVEGVYLPSFGLISANGREAVVREIESTAAECAQTGRTLLEILESSYPGFSLKRNNRIRHPRRLSFSELRSRLDKLGSDLDRINAPHRNTPRG